MSGFWGMFVECGWAAWAVLFFTMIALLAGVGSLVATVASKKIPVVVPMVGLVVALVPPSCGAFGTMTGRNRTDSAVELPGLDPVQREKIRAVGYEEAGQCTKLGAGGGALPVLCAIVAIGVALSRKKEASAALSRGADSATAAADIWPPLPKPIAELLDRCLNPEPTARPTAAQCVEVLSTVVPLVRSQTFG